MRSSHGFSRLAAHVTLGLLLLGQHVPPAVAAEDTTFELRPHCIDGSEQENIFGGEVPDIEGVMIPTDGMACSSYPIFDPQSRATDVLSVGDTLDMDLIVHNPSNQPIGRIRAWLQYDPSILRGESIELGDTLSVPTPGEQNFDEANGIAKIAASSTQPSSKNPIVVARIKMTVLATPSNVTPIRFDVSGGADPHAGIYVKNGNQETNVLPSTVGHLVVKLDGAAPGGEDTTTENPTDQGLFPTDTTSSTGTTPLATSSVASQSFPPAPLFGMEALPTSAPSSAGSTTAPSTFTALQVQNLRATTEETSIYLAWDALPSSELVGYNVYYGTVSGRYIQRRAVNKGATTLTLRGLMPRTAYYIAVRGVNAKNEETQFSQEVGITVGEPSSSTNPLTATSIGPAGKTPKTGGKVAGDSGPASVLTLFLIGSAVIGTFFAFRRQFTATTSIHG